MYMRIRTWRRKWKGRRRSKPRWYLRHVGHRPPSVPRLHPRRRASHLALSRLRFQNAVARHCFGWLRPSGPWSEQCSTLRMRQRTPSRKPWKVGPNLRLRIVPADIEMPPALRARHTGDLRLEPRPSAALGAHGVTWAPARRQPSTGGGRPSHHRPPGGRAGHDVEGGARHAERLAVDVEHGLEWREPNDSVPRAVSEGLNVVGTQSGPLG